MKRTNYVAHLNPSDKIYVVTEYKLLTHNVAQIFLASQSSQPLKHEAGQYIKVVHPDQTTSPFSIANAPQASSQLELHLLFLKENTKAMNILNQVKEQKTLTLRGPYGQCTPSHMAKKRPIIFIGRSTGFSPIKAVIEALIQQDDCPPIHFYWSAPGWRDLYLRDLINRWVQSLPAFHFTAVLTRELSSLEEGVKFGPVAELVLQDYPDLSAHQVYVSGPETMVYPALAAFEQRGLPREYFYSDVFDFS